jgi:hypothetical protein
MADARLPADLLDRCSILTLPDDEWAAAGFVDTLLS